MTLYAPPAIPQFAGNPTTTLMDAWIQAPLGFQTQGILFRAERHASQSLTASTNNVIDYDTVLEDPYSGWNSGTFKWFAPYTGWYEITVTGAITAATMIIAPLVISIGGNTVAGSGVQCLSTFPGIASASLLVGLSGNGGWVQGGLYVSATATTNTANGRYSTIEVSFVSQ